MSCALGHAPFLRSFARSSRSSLSPSPMASSSARIAIVGDVHGQWDLGQDSKALQLLQPDLVLFTGDFGEEDVELVQSIADLNFPKAVILGNHDAWYTSQYSERKKDRVQLQLECLGEEHVAYERLDFAMIKMSVVGGRPFSCGGERIFRKRLLSARYGVQGMDESAKRIFNAALGTPEGHIIIFLAHNGPTGLGTNMNDICGKDWALEGGDHGDQDLAQALSALKEINYVSPLVVFGHMHKELAHGGLRKMIVVGADNTIYLNGAIVPRVKRLINEQGSGGKSFTDDETPLSLEKATSTMRAFTLVDISDGRVVKVAETWVSVIGDRTTLEPEHILFSSCN